MKDNKDVPLRVRLTPAEDKRLEAAIEKSRLTKSEYVRWALENANSHVLGVTLAGAPVQLPKAAPPAPVAQKPKKQKAPEPPPRVEVPPLEPDYCLYCPAAITPDEAARWGTCAQCGLRNQPVEEFPAEQVPDVLTAMGLAAPPTPSAPRMPRFDDSNWE